MARHSRRLVSVGSIYDTDVGDVATPLAPMLPGTGVPMFPQKKQGFFKRLGTLLRPELDKLTGKAVQRGGQYGNTALDSALPDPTVKPAAPAPATVLPATVLPAATKAETLEAVGQVVDLLEGLPYSSGVEAALMGLGALVGDLAEEEQALKDRKQVYRDARKGYREEKDVARQNARMDKKDERLAKRGDRLAAEGLQVIGNIWEDDHNDVWYEVDEEDTFFGDEDDGPFDPTSFVDFDQRESRPRRGRRW